MPVSPYRRGLTSLVLSMVFAWTACLGQTVDEIDPTGGLRSRDTSSRTRSGATSREELMRQWDLDFNGTIDPSEAAVARARMRRSRTEMEAGSEIDPLTGKPREAVEQDSEGQEQQREAIPPVDPPAPRKQSVSRDSAPPGTRVPRVGPVTSGTSPRGASRSGAVNKPTGEPRPWSSLAPARPGARPGYGSISPKPDLNAGLPKPIMGRGVPGSPRGGLLPAIKSPVPIRPAAPPAPRPRPQPVTADDIGGF